MDIIFPLLTLAIYSGSLTGVHETCIHHTCSGAQRQSRVIAIKVHD
jgi:hypothetical protein